MRHAGAVVGSVLHQSDAHRRRSSATAIARKWTSSVCARCVFSSAHRRPTLLSQRALHSAHPPSLQAAAGSPSSAAPSPRALHADTLVVHGSVSEELYGAFRPTSVPLYQTATFASPTATSTSRFDYTRSGNPTRAALQQQLAAVEGAQHAYAFTSGMAALSTVVALLKAGEAVLASDDMYGGTVRLLSRVVDPESHPVAFCDHSDLAAVERVLRSQPRTRVVMVSAQTTPRLVARKHTASSSAAGRRSAALMGPASCPH